jgi:pimeloyl-ACP methyl ester carboxylesterase
MPVRRLTVEGVPLRVLESGAGTSGAPPVVLVHGVPVTPALWRHVLSRIEARARVLSFELLGYGESTPEGEGRDISVGRQASLLLGALTELGVERAVLVGHDLGGGVVHIAAVREPDRAAGLVVTNGVCYDSWPVWPIALARRLGFAIERLPLPVFRRIYAAFFPPTHDDAEQARESFRAHWPAYEAHGGARAFARQLASLDTRDTLVVAPRIRKLRGMPAAVVWGEADRFVPVEYGERLAHDLDVPLRRIPGGMHFTPEDHPDEVASAVLDVLAEATAAAS